MTDLATRIEGLVGYPPHMVGDDPFGFKKRLRATYDRISAQVDANVREEKERRLALQWCRANGNPHLEQSQ